jgi:hypothetical protein
MCGEAIARPAKCLVDELAWCCFGIDLGIDSGTDLPRPDSAAALAADRYADRRVRISRETSSYIGRIAPAI